MGGEGTVDPRHESADGRLHQPLSHVARRLSDPYRILLAEDGPDNQRLISFLLEKAGADVTVVDNGQLAVEKALGAKAERRPYDLVLMDMQMPVMDGYAATERLRQAGYDGSIVALTAYAMKGDGGKCLKVGCDSYLAKPIRREALVDAVERWAMKPCSRTTAGSVEKKLIDTSQSPT
jgi:CheY-like chemotaxis protein